MSLPATHASHQPDPAGVQAVVCYLRTANPGTVGQRLLDRQRARLHAASAAHGWTVVAWIEDLHQSGTTLDRPGLRAALALLAHHQADVLLATDTTRLAVDVEVGSQLAALADRQGWQVLTLSPSPPASATPAPAVDGGDHLGRGGARQ